MTYLYGGDVLARSLAALGVREVFCLHGGHLDSFLVACADAGIRLTDTRHEATAGYAATAFARASGQVGVCAVTSGPGFTNVLTAVTDAWLDAAPMLVLTSAPPLREDATNPLQGGFDQIAMALPVTKWAYRVTKTERIPDLIDKAIRLARSGRPGPVVLEFPIDVLFDRISPERVVMPHLPAGESRPAPSAEYVDRMLAMLRGAERPVIILGGGAATPDCAAALDRFTRATGIPVVASAKGVGVLSVDHPANAGHVSLLGAMQARGAPPDVVLQLGARGGLFLGGRGGAIVPHASRLIRVDIDGAEIGRIKTPDLAIVADGAETAIALANAAAGQDWPELSAWRGMLATCRTELDAPNRALPLHTDAGLIHPYHAVRGVMEALSPDTAIGFDGGETISWLLPFMRAPGPGLMQGNGYLGTLGVGQGFGLGMARARPGKPVALLLGDGASGFHIAEFDTFRRHGLPIVTIIMNNAGWGISRHGQALVFGQQRAAAVHLPRSAYHIVAEGFDCAGEVVSTFDEIAPAIRRAQASDRPTCINLMIDGDVVHPNIVRMIGDLDGKDEIPIPYYENIPLDR